MKLCWINLEPSLQPRWEMKPKVKCLLRGILALFFIMCVTNKSWVILVLLMYHCVCVSLFMWPNKSPHVLVLTMGFNSLSHFQCLSGANSERTNAIRKDAIYYMRDSVCVGFLAVFCTPTRAGLKDTGKLETEITHFSESFEMMRWCVCNSFSWHCISLLSVFSYPTSISKEI